jgi:hypothetical protein
MNQNICSQSHIKKEVQLKALGDGPSHVLSIEVSGMIRITVLQDWNPCTHLLYAWDN